MKQDVSSHQENFFKGSIQMQRVQQMKKLGRRVQKGFTLIELMIVVAIIGILAAIAIPQYQDYVTRSRWTNTFAQIQPLKQAIAECAQNNGGTIAATCDTDVLLKAATGYPQLPTPADTTVTLETGGVISMAGGTTLGGCTVTATPDGTTDPNALTWKFANAGTGTGATATAACSKSKTGV